VTSGRIYRFVLGFCRTVLSAFFRDVEVSGLDNVPAEGGGIFVAWHPNGMVDPGLILTSSPRRVVFGARHSAFRWPVFGWMMRVIGTVPIYRAKDLSGMDAEARRTANLGSLDALASSVASGSFSCLFPEGESHDAPHPLELKTGAARLYYRARQLTGDGRPAPVIIPVGLHYDAKREFRSKALVRFHPPLTLSEELDVTPDEAEPREARQQRCRSLTDRIEEALHDVVGATESWDLHFLMHRARKLIRAERARRACAQLARPKMLERTLGYQRVRQAYNELLRSQPARVAALKRRVAEYDSYLQLLHIEDHELDQGPELGTPKQAVLLVGQVILVYLLLPPLLLVGYLVNAPVAIGLLLLSKLATRKRKDEASIKVLFGAVAFPVTWITAGTLAGMAHHQLHHVFPIVPDVPVRAGLFVVALGIFGGALGVRYIRLVRETARAVRVRLTRRRRRRALRWLKRERAELCDALLAFSEGLDLPGNVMEDGRIGV